MDTNIKLYRALLLVFGCLPMVVLHVLLSIGVLLFPLPALVLGGNPMNILFVIWWALGSYGVLTLVYSCATYRRDSRGLKRWQQIGLALGVLLAVPLVVLGFADKLVVLAAVLGAIAAVVVFVSDRACEPPKLENANGRT